MIGAAAPSVPLQGARSLWLRDRRWDLTFITLSVALVAAPYLIYLGLLNLQGFIGPLSRTLGATPESVSRNLVNFTIAFFIGGPHMYATITRTALDLDFVRDHRRFLLSSLVIPAVVVAFAIFNLSLLLTVFFVWASIHVLHQIIYITDLYEQRRPRPARLFSRLSDYAVILTSLYPIAAWKIANGQFAIGSNNLSAIVGGIVPLGPWMVWLAGGAFAVSFVAWLAKTAGEWRAGRLHAPQAAFIALTVVASFFVPALGNLDTAFQGMNVWHSLQYLALTWMLNNLRQRRGELEGSRFVERLSTDGSARRYYLFNIGLTVADVALAGVLFVVLRFAFDKPFDYAFDRAYYIAVLSFLWIHYYFDHYLFTQPEIIGGEKRSLAAALAPAVAKSSGAAGQD
jgi:hypothetical protein